MTAPDPYIDRLQAAAPQLLALVEAHAHQLDAEAMADYGLDIRNDQHPHHAEWLALRAVIDRIRG